MAIPQSPIHCQSSISARRTSVKNAGSAVVHHEPMLRPLELQQ
jgi:hypothetical protein